MPAKKSSTKKSSAKKQTVARKTGAKKTAQPAAAPRNVPGTLLRGADGNLYFVPDSALEPFRVFDSERTKAESYLGEAQAATAKTPVESIHTTISIASQAEPISDTALPIVFVSYLAENQ